MPLSVVTLRRSLLLGLAACGLLPHPAARAGSVEVTRVDGAAVEGRLVRLADKLELETTAGTLHIPVAELMSVATKPSPAPPPPSSAFGLRFDLADDSSFAGRVAAGGEREFTAAFAGGECRLDPRLLRSVTVLAAPPAARQKFAAVLAESDIADDVAVAGRGDSAVVLRGLLKRLEPDRVVFVWNGKETDIPWERLAGVRLARTAARGSSSTVVLANGDVLAGRVESVDGEALVLRSGVLRELQLTWSQVARIEWRSEKLVYLSTLRPARYEPAPLFEKSWPYSFDRTLSGAPLRLARREFRRGITMHSRSRLVFELSGDYEKFAATAGISDEVGKRGNAVLRVLGDGRVLWEAEQVRGGQPPQEVVVPLTGIGEFVLEVDFGDDLDLGDQVIWGAARLIRSGAE